MGRRRPGPQREEADRDPEHRPGGPRVRRRVPAVPADLVPLPRRATALSLGEEPAETERLDRAAIRNDPPDILLTDYKQLEFLLVRRDDRRRSLGYLVVDEIHSYRGALAAEIACLIRRLKAHAGLRPGELVAIGTSALENLGLVGVDYEFLAELADYPRFQEAARQAGLEVPTALALARAVLDALRKNRAVAYDFFQEYIDPSRKRRYRELEGEPYGVRFPDRDRSPRAFALDRPDHIRKVGRLMGFVQENPRAGQLTATRRSGSSRARCRFHGRPKTSGNPQSRVWLPKKIQLAIDETTALH